MRPREVLGVALGRLVGALPGSEVTGGEALAEAGERPEELYRALLTEPLCVAHVGPHAPAGPTLRLSDGSGATRLVPCPSLGVPVVPLFISGAAMGASGEARGLWGDGVERGQVLERGAAFPLLRGTPGVLLVADELQSLPLDAGEVAALADGQTPDEYRAALVALVAEGRAREAAARLASRPLYVLDHPAGGVLMLDGRLPAFLHLRRALAFAEHIAPSLGGRPPQALVGGSELFRSAYRGRRSVLLDPPARSSTGARAAGPAPIELRSHELR